ncbi:hypothetical protein OIU78_027931 [Salix suchowensis]|nr:hypothetical protein OIU78_027931 [Salix suchowensis]
MLQDVCVADFNSGVKVNGFTCRENILAGTQTIAATLFAAQPPVPDNVLTKAFQVGAKEVQKIKSKFAPKK